MMASVINRRNFGDIPKVTVIITSHNHEAYINTCVQSVLNQTFTDFHLVIVDTGSTDRTMYAINYLRDSRIMSISLLPRIKAEAMNIAMNYVLGEYVLELDGDGWIDPQTLQILVTEMDAQPPTTGMVYANRKIWLRMKA